jgi:hypothetical protein
MFIKIKYKPIENNKRNKTKKIRNFGTLNKFLKGVKITKTRPIRLLIKNLGYRRILVQKLFI